MEDMYDFLIGIERKALSSIARVKEEIAKLKLQEIAEAAKEIATHGQQSYMEVLDSVIDFLNKKKGNNMSYIKHHAIVVTGHSPIIGKAHKKALKLFNGRVSNLIESDMNNYKSFFIAPDGSKEGWECSQIGDKQREKFKKWIKKQSYSDGSNPISFCEVSYSD